MGAPGVDSKGGMLPPAPGQGGPTGQPIIHQGVNMNQPYPAGGPPPPVTTQPMAGQQVRMRT